jgi:hypothetical protein
MLSNGIKKKIQLREWWKKNKNQIEDTNNIYINKTKQIAIIKIRTKLAIKNKW